MTFFAFHVIAPRLSMVLPIALASSLLPGSALALDAIGTAVVVEGQVSGSFSGHTSPLAKGDGVVSNEVVRTQIASSSEIGFVDQTKLFVGPSSSIKLDQFTFDQSGSASRFTVDVTKGALRFISGRSAHEAYGVKTPLGSLGVRGTIVDVVIERGRVIITDQRGPDQGPVVVTARNGQSVTLQPGQSAILTAAGISAPGQGANVPDFAVACGGGCTALLGFGGPLGVQPHEPAGSGAGEHAGGGEKAGQQGQSSSSTH
jgi:hypothetical protein